jgi:hypothetical protein
MPNQIVYHLGKVIKLGNMKPELVVEAIFDPKPVYWWKNSWSFFDAKEYEYKNVKYVWGKLSKFNPEGEVIIADPASNQEKVQAEPNLQIASSFFVYVPSLSGIAFSKVTNHINEYQFQRLFCQIVNERHFGRLAECHIEFISDLKSFAQKLLSLDGISGISAQVFPPNPIFGPLWEPLKEYIQKRRSEKMMVREDSGPKENLATKLPQIVEAIINQQPDKPFVPEAPLPIGDAAVLMAADGYGSGQVKGRRGGEMVIIKTSETIKNFALPEEHTPEELFLTAYDEFKQIEKDRHMKH